MVPVQLQVVIHMGTDRGCRGQARSQIRTWDYVLPTVRCAPIEPPGRLEVRIEFCEVSSETYSRSAGTKLEREERRTELHSLKSGSDLY
jgi:hypothetical protein